MKRKNTKVLKSLISLALVALMAFSYVPSAIAATPPSRTENTNGSATVTQEATWTNPGSTDRKASVQLTFDGFSSVMETSSDIYDYALIFDGSASLHQENTKASAEEFVRNLLREDPQAHITVMTNGHTGAPKVGAPLYVHIKSSNDNIAIYNAIKEVHWGGSGVDCDYVQPGCEKAYDLHKEHKDESACQRKLMFVIITDGDFAYLPASMMNKIFSVDYHGDNYSVESYWGHVNTKALLQGRSIKYNGEQYLNIDEFWARARGQYTIYKNGTKINIAGGKSLADLKYGKTDDNTMVGSFAQILYLYYYREQKGWEDTVFSTICIPRKGSTTVPIPSYEKSIQIHKPRIKARWAADEGYNFEVKGTTVAKYNDAYNELLAKVRSEKASTSTRVVNFETTIDSRYFEVDQAALAAQMTALGSKCTYTVTSVTGGQKVSIEYSATTSLELLQGVNIPVTLKSGIPTADVTANGGYLPVVLDNSGGCSYQDSAGTVRDIRTGAVYLDVSQYFVTAGVITGDATNITQNSATIIDSTYSGITGTINNIGIQYSTNQSMASAKTVRATSIGSPFTVDLTGLQPNTTYYYRAGVVTSSGNVFGDIKSFKTPAQTQNVITGSPIDIVSDSAFIIDNTYSGISGTINNVGIQYSTSPSMTSVKTVRGTSIGSPYHVQLTGLQPKTTYYYRAGVVSSSGTYFGEIKSFTTADQ